MEKKEDTLGNQGCAQVVEWTDEFNPFNSLKALRWGEHMARIKGWIDSGTGELLPPVVVNLDVAGGVCNFKCPNCHHAYMHQDFGEKLKLVPREILLDIPRFLHDWGVKSSCIVGTTSDATLNPSLADLLKEMHYHNLDVGLVSNGYKFDERLINHAAFYTKFVGFSIDSASPEGFARVKGVSGDKFHRVIGNLEKIASVVRANGLRRDIGYKFLILPETYHELYEAAKLAKKIGCKHLQVRPAHLPDTELAKINVEEVTELVARAQELNDQDFQVVGIRHKFSPELKKVTPKVCYLTPLTSTWTADGNVWPCVDRRHYQGDKLCNYVEEGLQRVREVWGSTQHRNVIRQVNQTLDQCIRCSNYGYNKFYRIFDREDPMDVKLI